MAGSTELDFREREGIQHIAGYAAMLVVENDGSYLQADGANGCEI